MMVGALDSHLSLKPRFLSSSIYSLGECVWSKTNLDTI